MPMNKAIRTAVSAFAQILVALDRKRDDLHRVRNAVCRTLCRNKSKQPEFTG